LKTNASEKDGSSRPKRRNSASRVVFGAPIGREDILSQPVFHAMLTLERRRAERSRKPFVLVLVDSHAIQKSWKTVADIQQMSEAVSESVRESDLIGWYEGRSVFGVIFTEVNTDQVNVQLLCSKIATAIRETIGHQYASKCIITAHVFPDHGDHERNDEIADRKLYPDLSQPLPRKRSLRIVKRGIDILGSSALLLALFPLLVAIAVAIKLTSNGPILYRQERLGQFGKRFLCLKFRTMYQDNDAKIHREYVQSFITGQANGGAEEAGAAVYKIQQDPRVTSVGRILRKLSFDELPQFWNVLRGEMSLVGPRPPVPYEFEVYRLWHRRRVLEIKPGVTGLWQVYGRSRTCFDDMVRLDLRYSQKWSLWLDLKILLATPLAVFTGDGAY
jgi:lipopolysaccharide/colanic/teichoic acid biosynthesis glycosyltransferase